MWNIIDFGMRNSLPHVQQLSWFAKDPLVTDGPGLREDKSILCMAGEHGTQVLLKFGCLTRHLGNLQNTIAAQASMHTILCLP